MSNENKIKDYQRGAHDCAKGEAHRSGESDSYDRGYADQYAAEQSATAKQIGDEYGD